MKVFLTGITGFLGSHVAQDLLTSGHDVMALVRRPDRLHPDLAPWLTGNKLAERGSLELVQGSLADASAIDKGLREADAIVHVAGLVQARREEEFFQVNRDGAAALASAAHKRASAVRRFVLVSSQAAGGPSRDGRPVTGEEPPRPVSAYGRSKRAGEEAVLAAAGSMPVTILRPPVIFGPRDAMLLIFFKAVARGLMVVWGDGTNRFSLSFAPDVARAATLSLTTDHPSGSIVYPSYDRDFDWRSLTQTLGAAIGRTARVLPLPGLAFVAAAAGSATASFFTRQPPMISFDKIRELREPYWLCSNDSARRLLGWSPGMPVEHALAQTHDWYKSRGLL